MVILVKGHYHLKNLIPLTAPISMGNFKDPFVWELCISNTQVLPRFPVPALNPLPAGSFILFKTVNSVLPPVEEKSLSSELIMCPIFLPLEHPAVTTLSNHFFDFLRFDPLAGDPREAVLFCPKCQYKRT